MKQVIKLILKRKAKTYLFLHFGCVFIFAFLYWISDFLEFKNPKISKKYLNDTGRTEGVNTFMYYLWFSLVTQTTVGYSGLQAPDGKAIFISQTDYPYQIINMLQIMSIFIIPVITLII